MTEKPQDLTYTVPKFRPTDLIAVRAIDGRWNYGPAMLEAALRSEETGVYPDQFTAFRAALKDSA